MSEPGGMAGAQDTEATGRLPVLEKSPDRSAGTAPATVHDPPDGANRTRRFWSPRRVPSGIVALLVLAGSGLLLYDLAWVRAGNTAMYWRRFLADQLATRPLDDVAVLAGAAAAAALGLWLLLLACTPGQRSLLTMRPVHADVRAGLHRGTIALVLRDRAMEVRGVRSAGVRTGRRGVRVRALAHFRELDEVRSDLHKALSDGIRDLGLAHPPALTVQVSRSDRRS